MASEYQDALFGQVNRLEDDVAAAERRLADLEERVRTMKIEADAARNPQHFKVALLARDRWSAAMAGPLGFFLGLTLGAWAIVIVRALLWRG